jgi:hypothetical protein
VGLLFENSHGTAGLCKSTPQSEVNASGPSAEHGEGEEMIRRVTPNPFAPLFAAGWVGPWGW